MNYKSKIKLIIFLILMAIPLKTSALAFALQCNKKNISPGESVNCTLSADIDENEAITSFEAEFSSSDDMIELTKFLKGDSWSSGETDRISVTSEAAISGGITIGTITVIAKDNITSGNHAIKVEYGEVSAVGTLTVEEDDEPGEPEPPANTLSDLRIDDESIVGFDPEIFKYDLITEAASITIVAKGTVNDVIIKGAGTKRPNYGLNTYNITVGTGEDANTYVINITRNDTRDSSNILENFYFNNYNLNFSSSTFKYQVNLEKDAGIVAFCPSDYENDTVLCIDYDSIRYSENATVEFVYNSETIDFPDTLDKMEKIGNLNEGNNTLLVKVTAENETAKSYSFDINRKGKEDKTDLEPSGNAGTGDALIVIIAIILVTSLGVVIYVYRDKLFAKIKRKK